MLLFILKIPSGTFPVPVTQGDNLWHHLRVKPGASALLGAALGSILASLLPSDRRPATHTEKKKLWVGPCTIIHMWIVLPLCFVFLSGSAPNRNCFGWTPSPALGCCTAALSPLPSPCLYFQTCGREGFVQWLYIISVLTWHGSIYSDV